MLKINFGCGSNILPGWDNHDCEIDITKTLPFDSNTINYIFAEHVMEHITTHEAYYFLKECYRILIPGGVVRITVPSIAKLNEEYVQEYGDFFKAHGHSDGSKRGSILNILLGNEHKSAWDERLLQAMMFLAEFENNKIVKVGVSDHEDLNNIEGHWRVVGHLVNNLESISIEGIK